MGWSIVRSKDGFVIGSGFSRVAAEAYAVEQPYPAHVERDRAARPKLKKNGPYLTDQVVDRLTPAAVKLLERHYTGVDGMLEGVEGDIDFLGQYGQIDGARLLRDRYGSSQGAKDYIAALQAGMEAESARRYRRNGTKQEGDIVYESANGVGWVWHDRKKDAYVVFKSGATHSTAVGTYGSGAAYLERACARADSLASMPRSVR